MPNLLPLLIYSGVSEKNINTITSNGKRFLAYEIVKKLEEQNNTVTLLKIAEAVVKSDKDRWKKHQVFERSFDCKQITSEHFFLQKLSYMHNNPCSGVCKEHPFFKHPVDTESYLARHLLTAFNQ